MQTLVSIILVLRTFAFYEQNRWVLCLLVCMGMTVIGCSAWILSIKFIPIPIVPTLVGCNSVLGDSEGHHLAMAWSGLLAFDTVVFLLTLYKSVSLLNLANRTFINVMLRDGSAYYGCMVLANLLNILTLVLGSPLVKGKATIFANIISGILVARLMLNLRDPRLRIGTDSPRSVCSQAIDAAGSRSSDLESMVLFTEVDLEVEEGSHSLEFCHNTNQNVSPV